MAVATGKIFIVTTDRKIKICDTSSTNAVWETIGDAPGSVVAMGATDGKLYVSLDARSAGRLKTRDAVTTNAPWEDIGHAWCLVGMAGTTGKLYSIIDTKELGSEAVIMVRNIVATPEDLAAEARAPRGCDGLPWNGVERRPPVGALAMTQVGGKFYVATKEDMLYVGDVTKPDVPWKQIGDAAGVTCLAGGDGKLFAMTKRGRLLMWVPKVK
jgi:hypothetical protein